MTINRTQVKPEVFVQELSERYDFQVNYAQNVFSDKLFNVQVKQQKLKHVLNSVARFSDAEYVCTGPNTVVFRKRLATNQFVLSGIVTDSTSGQPVPGALVVTEIGFEEADQDGFFQVRLKSLSSYVEIYKPGFFSKAKLVTKIPGIPLNIALRPDNTLNPAVVDIYDSLLMVRKTGGVNINMTELNKIPSIAGSPGILNSLRFLPSIQSTVEVNGGMVVQGGGRDQNLVLFDGMELYNPMHLFGLFSVFDENSIQSVSFYKNAIPPMYSGRLSSVLDVKSRVGDFQKWRSRLNINPVLMEGLVEGPIKKDKTSLLVSARRSFTDFFPLFYEQIQAQNELARFKYYFYDVTSTINHKFSPKSSLYVTGYYGGDIGYIRDDRKESGIVLNETENDEFVQSNLVGTAGVKSWITNRLLLHVKTGFTQYGFSHSNTYNLEVGGDLPYIRQTELAYNSSISDWKTGIYVKSLPRNNHAFNMGIENVWHNFSPSNSSYFLSENDLIYYDTTYGYRNSRIQEQRYFFSDVYAKKNWKILTGFQFVNFANEATFQSFQPRFNTSYTVRQKNRLEAGYARTSQFMLFVPNNLLGIPIDIWIPADNNIDPMHCDHYTVSYSRKIGSQNLAFRANAYYKIFQNVIEYKNGVADFIAEWDEALWKGEGRARGVEVMLKKEKGKFNGWMAYALSKSERSIPELNSGAWFPFQFDRRHDFKTVLHYQYTSNLTFGLTWSYASGNYLTAPEIHYIAEIEGNSYLVEQYGAKNNLKLPAFHRLDLGVHHKKYIGNALQTWSFTVYNAYNRANVFYVNSELNSSGGLQFYPISILPILPSVNYAIAF